MPDQQNFDQIFQTHRCFLKGDISGIQDFIFGIQSANAAKVLRARSFYVYAISELAIALLKSEVGSENVEIMYNGGGNFYAFIKHPLDENAVQKIRRELDLSMRQEALHLTLSYQNYNPQAGDSFKTVWKGLNQGSAEDKLRRFWATPEAFGLVRAFEPMPPDDGKKIGNIFKKFGRQVSQEHLSGFSTTTAAQSVSGYGIAEKSITKFGFSLTLTREKGALENHIIGQIPRYNESELGPEYAALARSIAGQTNDTDDVMEDNDPLTFEMFAGFAKHRTGTGKLGVLKFDLDFLGDAFNQLGSAQEAYRLSDKIHRFFSYEITRLWNQTFPALLTTASGSVVEEVKFKNNISIVFSGGDDCLLVGAWDAVFAFAQTFHEAFEANFKKDDRPRLTLSAGLIMVDNKFPVVRFAKLADEALSNAKYAPRERVGKLEEKNRISFMGVVLEWDEFKRCQGIAHKVRDLILLNQEPRSILDRIARSATGFSRIQEQTKKGNVRFAKVWKLFYYVRQSKNKETIMQEIIHEYERALLEHAIFRTATNPQVFPLAARWAEFLTRKKHDQDER